MLIERILVECSLPSPHQKHPPQTSEKSYQVLFLSTAEPSHKGTNLLINVSLANLPLTITYPTNLPLTMSTQATFLHPLKRQLARIIKANLLLTKTLPEIVATTKLHRLLPLPNDLFTHTLQHKTSTNFPPLK